MTQVKRSPKSSIWAWISLVVAVIYLANPTAGVLELIPDNIPFVGNLDEAGAAWLIVAAVRRLRAPKQAEEPSNK